MDGSLKSVPTALRIVSKVKLNILSLLFALISYYQYFAFTRKENVVFFDLNLLRFTYNIILIIKHSEYGGKKDYIHIQNKMCLKRSYC